MHIRFGSDDSSKENKEQEGVRGGTKSGKTSNNTNHVETWEKGHLCTGNTECKDSELGVYLAIL